MTRSGNLRRALGTLLGVTVVAGLLAYAGAPAGAACSSPTSRTLSGTVEGQDDRYLYVLIGFDLHDASGHKIDMNGCPTSGAYSSTVSVNTLKLTGEGADSGTGLTKTWRLSGLPANAADAWVEVYPKTKKPYGATDVSRYGRVLRRRLPVPSSGIDLRLPLACGVVNNGEVGTNGGISGVVLDGGVPVTAHRVRAWTMAKHAPGRMLGWGMGPTPTDSTFSIAALAAEQSYTVWITRDGKTVKIDKVPVPTCGSRSIVVEMTAGSGAYHGTDTIGLRRGTTYLHRNSNSDGLPDSSYSVGKSTDQVVFGDWNGDGIDTIGLRRGNRWLLYNSATPTTPDLAFDFGKTTDTKLVIGDWNGDGKDDPGIRRGTSFYLRTARTTGPANIVFTYGRSTDKPLAGDWNGDGTDTIGVRRSDQFLLRNKNTTGSADIAFRYGSASDVPLAGDFNGDDIDTVGVRRGTTYLLRNWNQSGPATVTFTWGNTGDRAYFGDWDGV